MHSACQHYMPSVDLTQFSYSLPDKIHEYKISARNRQLEHKYHESMMAKAPKVATYLVQRNTHFFEANLFWIWGKGECHRSDHVVKYFMRYMLSPS